MRVISFDIGIKNMAYCIFAEGGKTIVDWGVMNLLCDKTPEYRCNCALKITKKTQMQSRLCMHVAKYQKGQEYFCEKHAKTSKYSLPNSEISKSKLQKCQDFGDLAKTMNRFIEYTEFAKVKRSKKETIDFFMNFVKTDCLEPIVCKKSCSKTANLIDIGREINLQLSAILLKFDPNREITHIIIENQISPIANRMKTIQGMLAQYFIMKYENCPIVIDFISSFNKLKMFPKVEGTTQDPVNTLVKDPVNTLVKDPVNTLVKDPVNTLVETSTNTLQYVSPIGQSTSERCQTNYKKHKKDGIYYCQQILEQNSKMNCVVDFGKHAKKDDLADSFLQGIWYLKSKNIITIADNLKINSVTQI